MTVAATIHIDGGSRGNPGPASFAVVLARPGRPDLEVGQTIGTATNNVAEYTGLIRGLEIATENGVQELAIFSDSELLVKQMNGEYRVKNAELQELFRRACDLRRQFQNVTLTHVRREQNKRADFLCNEALDGRPRTGGAEHRDAKAVPKPVKPAAAVGDERVRGDAIECLEAAAQSWADNGSRIPPPAMVWEQLWSILEEGGVLKKK